MTRYTEKLDRGPDEGPRLTKMVRVVDRQGYHLRWIEVPAQEDTDEVRPVHPGR